MVNFEGMRQLLVFGVATLFAGTTAFVVAQAPAKKTPPPPAQTATAKPADIKMPPIPSPGYAPGRPVDQTRAVYEFSARHPEVLKFVPCYCGCESTGHPHNESCFVKRRDARGNVTEWDLHGYG
jgi:hypothetical protein